MNKRFWMGFAACFITGQVLAFLIHGLWLNPVYESMASVWRPKAEMDSMMWVMMLSAALATFVFCYIFTRNYEGKGVAEGLRYGALIGVLVSVCGSIDQFWVYPIPFSLAFKWLTSGLAYWMVLGAVLALIYRPSPR